MTTRIAIIGAGIMGADHGDIVAKDLPGAKLQVVCDAFEARAVSLAEACGDADVSTDPFSVIARKDVDAVIVASPDHTHAELVMACIENNKPVLCEKPLAPTAAESLKIIKAEVAYTKQMVQIGFMRRFDQSYREMKSVLDNNVIGQPLMMHNFHRNVETPAADFTADMAITNSAPHEFDVARFILGSEYKFISSFSPKGSSGKVGPVFMVLETQAGQLVNIEINNNASYGYDVRGELIGEKGAVSLNSPTYTTLDLKLRKSTQYAQDWRARYREAYRRQNNDFVHFVQTGEFSKIASNSWDGYCANVTAEAGVKALATGQRTAIEYAQMPALYK